MTVLRAFLIVIGSAIGFALAGGAVGYALGTYAPGYYYVVFPGRNSIDTVETGIGLGITQGLTGGVLVGVVIVLAVTWYNLRRSQNAGRDGAGGISPADPINVSSFSGARKGETTHIKKG